MFQFSGFALRRIGVTPLPGAGLPHSDTRGSTAICAFPRIFAACRVLHRLWKPRHPPCALTHFLADGLGFRLAPALLKYIYLPRLIRLTPYAYLFCFLIYFHATTSKNAFTVENKGVEPLTPCLQSRCSSQLSYTPRYCG